ncbi:MAG: GNAT family N-acetyltransferase [Marinovum sp.]|nr:GNAT family N-acetyltransferase [Marinovum sp.]
MTIAPTLTTKRLILRHHKMADFEPLYDLLGSDRAKFMDGPYSRRQSWYGLASEVGSWSLKGFGSWGVELRDSKDFIGQIGINQPAHFPETEIGWIFLSKGEGKGYAFEAARKALAWAQDTLQNSSIVSYIANNNVRSKSLAKRLGATQDPNAARPEGDSKDDTLVYRHALTNSPAV